MKGAQVLNIDVHSEAHRIAPVISVAPHQHARKPPIDARFEGDCFGNPQPL
jgi:hypothetical protein